MTRYAWLAVAADEYFSDCGLLRLIIGYKKSCILIFIFYWIQEYSCCLRKQGTSRHTANEGPMRIHINVWFLFMYSPKWNCSASLFPKQNYNVLSPNSYTHIIQGFVCLFCCSQICGPILGIYKSLTDIHMNVEIGSEAAQFPEKEYINGFLGIHKWEFRCSAGCPVQTLSSRSLLFWGWAVSRGEKYSMWMGYFADAPERHSSKFAYSFVMCTPSRRPCLSRYLYMWSWPNSKIFLWVPENTLIAEIWMYEAKRSVFN